MLKRATIICIIVAIVVILWGPVCDFWPAKGRPVLKVITIDRAEEKDQLPQYSALLNNKRLKKTEPFEKDSAIFLYGDTDVFRSYIEKTEQGKREIVNRVYNPVFKDADGNAAEPDDTAMMMLQAIAKAVPHDIFEVNVIMDEGHYYAFIKLNVNLWDPCELYEYDKNSDSVRLLHQWDNTDLVGISLDITCEK